MAEQTKQPHPMPTTHRPIPAALRSIPPEVLEAIAWSDFFDAAEWDGTVSWQQGYRFVYRLGYLDSFRSSPWWALQGERLDAGELAAWVEQQED